MAVRLIAQGGVILSPLRIWLVSLQARADNWVLKAESGSDSTSGRTEETLAIGAIIVTIVIVICAVPVCITAALRIWIKIIYPNLKLCPIQNNFESGQLFLDKALVDIFLSACDFSRRDNA